MDFLNEHNDENIFLYLRGCSFPDKIRAFTLKSECFEKTQQQILDFKLQEISPDLYNIMHQKRAKLDEGID